MEKSLTEVRSYMVVKSNDLIQRSRFTLSVQEQKIVLFLISKIKPGDSEFHEYEFDIVDFCKVCGIYSDGGQNYENVKAAVKSLADKSIWIPVDDKKEVLVRWINKAAAYKGSGKITIRLDDDLRPYLLQLKARFTQYELLYVLAMKSQYSFRLYELLRSYEYTHKPIEVDIDALKKSIMAEKYERYADFKRYVIDIAIREINALSDLKVEYAPKKQGRRFAALVFTIELKKDLDERLATWVNIEKILNQKELP